ncbi:Holliday junction-specific endonuclease [Candidatus Phytoplasma pruni]|uniref:Holliday junction resolvase RecU n=1 Tax=Candidatus Phytoplasma pruni TaxID=479893 RepID=A0A0M1MZT0_9MOLU|nr:Holliday junction resolvase RecU [Candidatus Phytoplasma pruni]KOR75402.1 Holliday junction-specific endonuclease [Candidatus Phytoplasma pruni]
MDYPFKKEKNNVISNKNNLGANLERDINLTNRFYQEQEIALVYKNEIPIQVVRVEYPQRKQAKIVEAYYRTSSLPDYHGIYKGKFLSFDVKETNNKNNFPLSNIPQHQIEILQRAQKFNGIAFFIVHFKIKISIFIYQLIF